MKRFYVYLTLGGVYGLAGYVEASCETTRDPEGPGAREVAIRMFGEGADVAVAGPVTNPRKTPHSFLRVSNRVFVRTDLGV